MPKRVCTAAVKQVCHFLKSPTKKLYFNIVDIMRQRNTYDCGIHAIAIATDFAFNEDSAKSQGDIGKLRSYLISCLEGKKMMPFPVKGERCVPFACQVKFYMDINIHCLCRMPFDLLEAECSGTELSRVDADFELSRADADLETFELTTLTYFTMVNDIHVLPSTILPYHCVYVCML